MTMRDMALIVTTTLIWGVNFVVIKWGVGDIDAATMTALRFALVAFPLVFFVKKPSVPLKIIAGYGVLFGCGIWGLINYSISLGTPAGLASLLLQLSVFMTALAGVFVFNEKVSFNKATGIFLAFVGFMLVVAHSFSTASSLGIFLVFLAALSWAGCNVIIKIFRPNPDRHSCIHPVTKRSDGNAHSGVERDRIRTISGGRYNDFWLLDLDKNDRALRAGTGLALLTDRPTVRAVLLLADLRRKTWAVRNLGRRLCDFWLDPRVRYFS